MDVSDSEFDQTVALGTPLEYGRVYKCALMMEHDGEYLSSAVATLHAYDVSVQAPGDFYESDFVSHDFVFSRPSGASLSEPLSVRYSLSGAAAADYVSQLVSLAVIPAETTSVSVPLTPTDNANSTGARNLTVTIEPGCYMTNGITSSASVAVLDDEKEAQTIKWKGGAETNGWSEPSNWNLAHAPVITNDVYVEETDDAGARIDAPFTVRSFWVGRGKPARLVIENDLNASQASYLGHGGSGASVEVLHTAGHVNVRGGSLLMPGYGSASATYDISGADSVLEAANVKLVYIRSLLEDQPTRSVLRVRDGASVVTPGKLQLTPENISTPQDPMAEAELLIDGGSVVVGAEVSAAGLGGASRISVTNGSLTVGGNFLASMPPDDTLSPMEVDVWNGGRIKVGGTMTIAQSTGFNQRVTQWPGSSVEVTTLKLGDAGSCTGILSTNTVYEVKGGSLHVVGGSQTSVMLGGLGQAELRLTGGTFTAGNGWLAIDCQKTASLGGAAYSKPTTLHIGGDARVDVAGYLRPAASGKGGPVAIETEGGLFTADFGSFETAANTLAEKFTFIPTITATGLSPIHSRAGVSLAFPMIVDPRKKPGARSGTYKILTWEKNLTLSNGATISLAEGTNTSVWSLEVDTAGKCVKLMYDSPGFFILLR